MSVHAEKIACKVSEASSEARDRPYFSHTSANRAALYENATSS